MAETQSSAEVAYKAHLHRHSPVGRFERYCRYRIRQTQYRVIGTIFCAGCLSTVADWRLAVGFALLATAIDLIELLFLRSQSRKTLTEAQLPPLLRLSAVFAALHGLAIAIGAIVLTSFVEYGGDLFLSALLLSMTVDSAILAPLNKPAARTRFVIFIGAVFWAALWPGQGVWSLDQVFFPLAGTILILGSAAIFVSHLREADRRKIEQQRASLQKTRDLTYLNQELRASRDLTRRHLIVAERVDDGLLVVDRAGRITWSNQAFSDLTGLSSPDLLNRPVMHLPLQRSSEEARAVLRAGIDGRTAVRTELHAVHAEGINNWLDVSVTPHFDEDGDFDSSVWVFRDVGAQKERERALAAARETAEATLKAQDAFLNGMSHKIRTPMNGVLGAADLLVDTPLSGYQKQLAKIVIESGETLMGLVNEVLDYSTILAGRIALSEGEFSLKAVLNRVVSLARPLADDKGLLLTADWPDYALPPLIGDGERLQQILFNMVSSAITATETGNVSLSAEIRRNGADCEVVITVKDSRRRDDERPATDPVLECGAAQAAPNGRAGVGLGLPIAVGLAEALGGSLESVATSEPGATLRLSVAFKAAAPVPGAPVLVPCRHGAEHLTGRVLIVEKSPASLLLLEKMLADTDLQLVFATDPDEAVLLYQKHQPDLIIAVHHGSHFDGLAILDAVAARAAQLDQRVPASLLIAASQPTDLGSGTSPPCAFLAKPVRKDALQDLVARHISRPPSDLAQEQAG